MGKVLGGGGGQGAQKQQCQTLRCSRTGPLDAAMLHVPTPQNLAELSGGGKVKGHLLLTMGVEAGFTHMGRSTCLVSNVCPHSVPLLPSKEVFTLKLFL